VILMVSPVRTQHPANRGFHTAASSREDHYSPAITHQHAASITELVLGTADPSRHKLAHSSRVMDAVHNRFLRRLQGIVPLPPVIAGGLLLVVKRTSDKAGANAEPFDPDERPDEAGLFAQVFSACQPDLALPMVPLGVGVRPPGLHWQHQLGRKLQAEW